MKSSQRGFTLLEMIVAMILMSFLAIFTAGSIRNAIRSKRTLQADFDRGSEIRATIRLLQRDLNLAFHDHDPLNKMRTDVEKAINEPPKNAQQNNVPDFSQLDQLAPVSPPIMFIGEKNKLDFTALANIRTRENQQASSQARVMYYVDQCRSRTNRDWKSPCLWRRVIPYLGEEDPDKGETQPVLENVQVFELRYYGKEGEDPIDQWKSFGGLDGVTTNKFPEAVEIKLTVQNKNVEKDRSWTMVAMAPLRFPNNEFKPDDQQKNDPNNPNDPNGGGIDDQGNQDGTDGGGKGGSGGSGGGTTGGGSSGP